jgi:predicted amidohydrolase YtcJ
MVGHIATHAIGDRAIRTQLDVYERLLAAIPGMPPGPFVIDHAFLVDKWIKPPEALGAETETSGNAGQVMAR